MNNFLVTGGAGFIGSNMTRFLLDKGKNVRVLDNFSTGKRSNIQEIKDSIEVIEGDVSNPDDVAIATNGVDVILHLAAMGSVPRSIDDPIATHQANSTGTINILVSARQSSVRRVVFASSSSVYGQSEVLPQHEALPLAPISPYAASKIVGETYCKAFHECYGLQTVCLRYYNVFGPRQDPNGQYAAAIPLFVSAMLKDRAPCIFGDGNQTRGFTYIDNVLEANWLAATVDAVGGGEAINISTDKSVSVNYVVSTIKSLLDKDIQPEYHPPRWGDIEHSLADISLAKKLLGYDPKIEFNEGICKSIDWYRENL